MADVEGLQTAIEEGDRVVGMAVLMAVGVAATCERRILGLELAAGSDEGNVWANFLRRLVERGLAGVRLVISDAHRGLLLLAGATAFTLETNCLHVGRA